MLSYLIWSPMLLGTGLLMTKTSKLNALKIVACLLVLINTLMSAYIYHHFDATAVMQLVEAYNWLPMLGMQYHLGIDGISLPLIMLTHIIVLITIMATWHSVQHMVRQYLAAILLLQGLLIGVFASLDAVLFYIFWEATLLPVYLLIGIWGGKQRVYAATKFFVVTFVGSVCLLAAIVYLAKQSGSFNILSYHTLSLSTPVQLWIFAGFFLGFAIKIPMWPLHSWLPHAHTQASTGGSVLLAAVLLKMGAYGFLRFSLPIVTKACQLLSGVMLTLSLVAIIYISIVALWQADMKKRIAYSSIAHMGLITLGCFVVLHTKMPTKAMAMGLEGAMMLMISHGLIAAALFICIGYIYERLHTREINQLQGIANTMPLFAGYFMFFALANVAVPGMASFVGEFFIILTTMHSSFLLAMLAATTVFLSTAYTLWMYRNVMYGAVHQTKVAELIDIKGVELLSLVILAALVLLLGIYPQVLLQVMHPSIAALVAQLTNGVS